MHRELSSIQYLRGIAAMMVVFAHANEQFPSPTHLILRNVGWSGVDLFFVISGFVMTYIVYARPMAPAEFLRRRIARVAPLYWVMTAVTGVLVISLPNLFQHSQFTWSELATSFLFIPFRNPGSNEIAPLLKLGWTLNYEMFFYLCFAAFILSKPLRRTAALVCIFGTLLVFARVSHHGWAPLEFYGGPITFEFLFGCLIGCAYINNIIGRITLVGAGAILMIGIATLVIGSITPNLDIREIERGLPSALIVVGLLAVEQNVKLTSRWLHTLGDATYSIYLTHLFIVIGLHRFIRHVSADGILSYGFPLLAIPVCAVAGVAVYKCVEQRLIAAAKQAFVPHPSGLAA